jgi:hypothetical protein
MPSLNIVEPSLDGLSFVCEAVLTARHLYCRTHHTVPNVTIVSKPFESNSRFASGYLPQKLALRRKPRGFGWKTADAGVKVTATFACAASTTAACIQNPRMTMLHSFRALNFCGE